MSASVREYVYAPVARQYDIVGKIDAGECDAPVKLAIWPEEVNVFKRRILTILEARDLSVKACPGFPAGERAAWDEFTAGARPFLKRDTPIFGAYGEWVTTCGYTRYLDAFDVKLAQSGCKILGPENVSSGDAQSILKWVVAGAIVVAVAGVLITYAPTVKAFLPEKK